jgi:hypothetical protein
MNELSIVKDELEEIGIRFYKVPNGFVCFDSFADSSKQVVFYAKRDSLAEVVKVAWDYWRVLF